MALTEEDKDLLRVIADTRRLVRRLRLAAIDLGVRRDLDAGFLQLMREIEREATVFLDASDRVVDALVGGRFSEQSALMQSKTGA